MYIAKPTKQVAKYVKKISNIEKKILEVVKNYNLHTNFVKKIGFTRIHFPKGFIL